jgi:hypothetical protein
MFWRETVWKESVVAYLKIISGIHLEWLRNKTVHSTNLIINNSYYVFKTEINFSFFVPFKYYLRV